MSLQKKKKEENLDLFNFEKISLPDGLLSLLINKQSGHASSRRNIFKKTKRVLSNSVL